mmetsp:Transcript_7038/g.26379  ORF Transcript_7038/g.26379 Transcript_7038/m.26379 type:complete len:220 (+) Transcript_7038:189-848(+)
MRLPLVSPEMTRFSPLLMLPNSEVTSMERVLRSKARFSTSFGSISDSVWDWSLVICALREATSAAVWAFTSFSKASASAIRAARCLLDSARILLMSATRSSSSLAQNLAVSSSTWRTIRSCSAAVSASNFFVLPSISSISFPMRARSRFACSTYANLSFLYCRRFCSKYSMCLVRTKSNSCFLFCKRCLEINVVSCSRRHAISLGSATSVMRTSVIVTP